MTRRLVLGTAALCALNLPAFAQEQVTRGQGAVLRALEKVNGTVVDLDMRMNDTRQVGRISVTLRDCRYPAGNPAGDAYAFLTISEEGENAPAFEGWMMASSPALNALEHPRYDVWVLRCKTE